MAKTPLGVTWEVMEVIGRSPTCLVKKGRHRITREYAALKIMDKRRLTDSGSVEQSHREAEILGSISHPGVVGLLATHETDTHLVLAMELMEGGELFDRIEAKEFFTEKDAATTLRQICAALAFLHEKGIVHRDLKPENLLYKTAADDSPVKIADFGLARQLQTNVDTMATPCGTASYVAPEILTKDREYDRAVDCWSLGVVSYTLLCGFPPFHEPDTPALFDEIRKGRVEFPSPFWDAISPTAKDFVKGLLRVDPRRRMTAQQACKHPWLHTTSVLSLPSPGIMRSGQTPGARALAAAVGAAIDATVKRVGIIVPKVMEFKAPEQSPLWQRRKRRASEEEGLNASASKVSRT